MCDTIITTMFTKKFRRIGKYKISNICYETYPCQHVVKYMDGTTELMCSGDIYRLFKMEGLSDPHIDRYAEFVRKQDFPTAEEKQQRIDDQLRMQELTRKRKEEETEQRKIIDQYKASSRLDALKNKHNIKRTITKHNH